MTKRYTVKPVSVTYSEKPYFEVTDSQTGQAVARLFSEESNARLHANALNRADYSQGRESVVFHVSGFPGWYGSWLDSQLDSEIERDCEYIATEKDSRYSADDPSANYNFPEALKLSESDVSNLYYGLTFCDYREARNVEWLESLAQTLTEDCEGTGGGDRLESFWRVAVCALGYSLKYESMSSPREYNFTTDRLFAFGRLQAFRVMLRLARRPEYRDAWRAAVKARHSSYSGFISHYSNDSDSWGEDVRELDHNQLATLFAFALQCCEVWPAGSGRRGRDSWEQVNDSICDAMLNAEDSAFYQHCQIGDSAIAEARGVKLCEWLESEREGGQFFEESAALAWLASNPDSDVVTAAREHDSEVMRAAAEAIAARGESLAIRCDKTPDMLAAAREGAALNGEDSAA